MTLKEPNVAKDFKISQIESELSTIGLKAYSGIINEEAHTDLVWPTCKDTYARMWYDPTIAAANKTIKSFVRNAKYSVDVDTETPTPEQEAQIEFTKSCMGDMETSFNDVINEALSTLQYGFSVHEKVFKFRNNKGKFKSRFDDGKVGWAKLPIRSQDSISKWYFDAKGRDLTFVEQDLGLVANNYDPDNPLGGFKENIIKIPRKRFLHFRHDSQRNNPEGNSPLKSCYIPWRYKQQIEEYQAAGISRDLGGLPVIKMPPEYMSEDADADKKAVYEHYKNIIRNLHANEQAGLILPKFVDPDTKSDLFEFDLVSVDGGKMYDTVKIINNYENKILMTYLADVLKLGQDASGSFALSDNKTNLLAVGIKAIIEEILQVFNDDLIPQTLKMNGWEDKGDFPKILVDDLDERDIEKLGKFLQQSISVGAMETDQGLSDWTRVQIGAPPVDRTKPLDPTMVAGGGNAVSRSGDGMKTSGDGTASKPSGGDSHTGSASK